MYPYIVGQVFPAVAPALEALRLAKRGNPEGAISGLPECGSGQRESALRVNGPVGSHPLLKPTAWQLPACLCCARTRAQLSMASTHVLDPIPPSKPDGGSTGSRTG